MDTTVNFVLNNAPHTESSDRLSGNMTILNTNKYSLPYV